MRVLYITTMYPTPEYPQKGIFCHEQVKGLLQLGVNVDVAAIIPIYDREVKVKKWVYEGVNIHYVRFFKLPGARDFHRTGYALALSLKRRFSLSKYDLLHADAALPTGQAAKILSREYTIPYVVHGHGLDVYLNGSYQSSKNVGKIEKACREVYTDASAILGVSQKVLDRIEENKNNQYVVFNGVDTDKFIPIRHENKKVKYISVGNLIPLKGHDLTIRAFKKINDEYPDCSELEIVGRGPLENELKELSASLGVTVKFTGYIPYEEVATRMAMSDVFVLPSWYEALGCVYLEAMSCGLPTIGCWENGIDEIVHDGEDGYLVHNKSEDELLEAMRGLLDSRRRTEMGSDARKSVVQGYSWICSAQKVYDIYEETIK